MGSVGQPGCTLTCSNKFSEFILLDCRAVRGLSVRDAILFIYLFFNIKAFGSVLFMDWRESPEETWVQGPGHRKSNNLLE